MSGKGSVFVRLEKFIGSKYPSFIKDILLHSGFDCESALLLINEERIKKIELDVAAKPELLNNTVYEEKIRNSNDEFQFLIGHRELILNIPETIRQKNTKKSYRTSVTRLETELDIDTLTTSLITKVNNYFEKKTSLVKLPLNIYHFLH